ncbi:MAG: DNA gyrase C-terminal beta-propeller domain-containing protein, partial [Campylobacter ureolyticus]|nr:DNA gyrase C-terminal beta-propeller domain-containing protein [Campylobacter ureolyticus]
IVLNHLFKSTMMETTFGVIMLAIDNKEPKIFTLKELLQLFLNHRKTVVIRRTIFDLQKARARAHILEGLKIALDNIDDVIELIKNSADTNSARDGLMSKFGLSELQSNAILDMRLSKLTGLEREKLEAELKEILELIENLEKILKSEELIEGIIKDELLEIKDKFKCPRITEIVDDYDDIDIEDLIPNENMVVTITHRGYIKRVPSKTYEKQKRGGKGRVALTTYDDDFIENFFICDTHDTLMFITDKGQLYWLKVYKIPEGSRTAKGKAVVNLIDLAPDEQIMAIIPTTDFADNKFLTIFTKNGIVKRTKLSEYANIRSVGIKAINLDDNDTVVTSLIIEKGDLDTDDDEIIDDENIDDEVVDEIEDESEVAPHGQMLLVATKKGMCIKFNVADVRETGRVTRGVTAIKFKEKDDSVIGAAVLQTNDQEILSVASKGIGKRTTAEEYRLQKRAGKGVICMRLTNKTGDLVGIVIVDDEMDLMALTTSGKMIRVDMQSIRKAGRNTSGVKVVNVDGEEVVNIAICPKIEDEETSEESDQLNLGESDE